MRYIFSTPEQNLNVDVMLITHHDSAALDIKFSAQTTNGRTVGLNQVNAGLSPEIRTVHDQVLNDFRYHRQGGESLDIEVKSSLDTAFDRIPTHIVVTPNSYIDSATLDDIAKGICAKRGLRPSQVEQIAASESSRIAER